MLEGAWKLFQRKLYSWLSSKCGLPICIVGLLLVLISAFQFGEVFLEWSKEKYAAQFSIYADNIAGKSYERYLCPELPIDIVYTWVNGSDPVLLAELRELRKRLPKKNATSTAASGSQVNSSNARTSPINSTTNSSLLLQEEIGLKCPFKNCVPWRSLILDSRNFTNSLDLDTLRTTFPLLVGGHLSDFKLVTPQGDHVTPVYAVRMPKEHDVSELIRRGFITDSSGRNVSVTRGYLTSDHSLVGAVKMEDFAIALSNGIRPLNNSKLFRRWMEAHFGRDVLEAEVKRNSTAVVRFRKGKLEQILKTNNSLNQLFSGEPVNLTQAYLIWLPFSLPASAWEEELERVDIISANRFQDNEELRYSLRSIEQFAPWVRQIFIVTNGQIPSWLNLDNPRLTIVTHKDIFVNQSHLPTYSSPAIESHIHRIPGLSKNFLYLNDDVMFGDEVWPEDFYTFRRGQKIYLAWPIPHCAEGCPPNWITDKYCDQACNNSACDWDGGDCANATRPGWNPGYSWSSNRANPADHCNTGCLNSWLGDRYCDSSCRVPQCGYDAGDCGTEKWDELLGYTLPVGGGQYNVPLGTKALYFNLTEVFPNGTTITSGEFGTAPIIRTSVISQKFKALSLTLSSNTSRSVVHFALKGKPANDTGKELAVNFTIICDTQTPNKTVSENSTDTYWNFNYNETHSKKFLEAVAIRIQNSNKSINYWVTERPSTSPTLPPPTSFANFTVTNTSRLPVNVSDALKALEQEYHEGDLTQKGYMKRRAVLLEPFKNIVTVNGTVLFGEVKPNKEVEDGQEKGHDPVGGAKVEDGREEGRGPVGGAKVEDGREEGRDPVGGAKIEDGQEEGHGPVGGARKLLSFMGAEVGEIERENYRLAEVVAIAKMKELSRERDLRKAVEEWEKKYGQWDPSSKPWESRRWLPWEKLHVFSDIETAADDNLPQTAAPDSDRISDTYKTGRFRSRKLMADDTFADSLRHVNRIYTKLYGHEARKVPAHMPHFIQSDVMRALQKKFPEEFERTSSHKVRTADDMQYAFSYIYFMMNEKQELDLEAAFENLDTDRSGILSVRELRTMLAMFTELPIDMNDVSGFEDLLRSCDKEYNGTRPSIAPVEYDTHYDPDLPLVTLDFTLHCQPLIEKINKTVTSRKKYKFEEASYDAVAFHMISENTSKVMAELDTIRKERKKFICLNDNINHEKEGADMAKLILLDFYESLFPIPSQFELPPEYRNRFLHVDDLNKWIQFRNRVQLLLHAVCGVLVVLCIVSLFYGKLIQFKRKLFRFLSTTLSFGRTRSTV